MLALAWLALGLAARAAPPPPSGTITYIVKRDETLLEIGHRALEPVLAYRDVQRLNHIGNDRRIPIGFPLIVPRAVLKTQPILATVEGVHGAATLAGDGGALAVGRTLGEGAVILTGANAFVRLGLPDDSHLAIPSNSRVRLDRLRLVVLTGGIEREIGVQSGGLESQVTPMRDPSSRFVVVTPVAQSAVRGTEFRVSYDLFKGVAASSVFKGAVGVSNPRAEALARAGQGVVATRSGLAGPLTLLPPPVLAPGAEVQGGEGLQFALTPVAGAERYRWVLAGDPKAEAPLFEQTSNQPLAHFPAVPDGDYYLRAAAISREGLEGEPSITQITRLRGDLAILGAAPGADGQIEFRWVSPGDAPPTYRFVLARRDDRQHPVVDRDGLTEPRIAVPGLAPGDYAWTVFSMRTVNGRRLQIVSDPQPLHVP